MDTIARHATQAVLWRLGFFRVVVVTGARDLSGLRALRADLGPRFKLGILAYLGEEARVLDPTLVAVPLAALLGVGAFPPSDPDGSLAT